MPTFIIIIIIIFTIFACGLSNCSVAIFHLANHAFFKALLFLGADSPATRTQSSIENLVPQTSTKDNLKFPSQHSSTGSLIIVYFKLAQL